MTAGGQNPTGPNSYAWSLDGETVALEIDTTVYSVEAILRAAYKFTDRLYAYIGPLIDGTASRSVALSARQPTTSMSPLIGEFMNELADQQLRITLEKEFGAVRSLIVAEAFADGPQPADDDDYLRDPLGAGRRR